MRKYIIGIMMSLLLFASCKAVKSLNEMNKEEPKIYEYEINGQQIKFCPIHHLGKQVYYENLKDLVLETKANGFKVYYELVSSQSITNDLQRDTLKRKMRKLKGLGGLSRENLPSYFKKYVPQPKYKELGIDSTDLRADVYHTDLIAEYEKRFGEILLDSIDWHTPFDSLYESDVQRKQWDEIIIGYRNDYLLDLILKNGEKKILILYGEGHRKDFKRKLDKKRKNKAISSIDTSGRISATTKPAAQPS